MQGNERGQNRGHLVVEDRLLCRMDTVVLGQVNVPDITDR